jgi:pre-mRNA-processing factor 8
MKVIHVSVWAGQKRLGPLSKWKAAEEVAALIRSLPIEEQPKQLIVTRRNLLDPLEVQMLDFPNISIRPSELMLPFKELGKLEKLADAYLKATEPQMLLYRLYDDWLDNNQTEPGTAFSRLILLLRAMQVNPDKTKLILRPDRSYVTKEHHLWPTLTMEQWVAVENQLSDMILKDFGLRNNVNVASLTQHEIRDIILGQEIQAPSQRRQEIAEIEQQGKEQSQLTALKTKTQNVHGEEMVVVTTSNYEQQAFVSKTEWRSRAISTTNLHLRAKNTYVDSDEIQEDGRFTYIVPENLLKKFIQISDLRVQVAGLLYGASPKGNDQIKEVKVVVMIPQLGNVQNIQLACGFSKDEPLLGNLEPLGWIHTQGQDNRILSPPDVVTQAKLMDSNSWDSQAITMTVSFTPGSVTLAAYGLRAEGLEWGLQNKDALSVSPQGFSSSFGEKSKIVLSNKIKGYFLVPEDGLWNYAFNGAAYTSNMKFDLKLDLPLPFYHELHRPIHFTAFNALESDNLESYQEDVFA